MGKRCTKWVGDQHPPATSAIFSTSFYIFSLFPIFFCLQFKTLDAFLGIFIVSSISCFASVPSGGFFVANLFFSIDQSPPPHYSGPCIYNEHFYIYFFVLHFFVIYSHIFLILVYNKNMYICTFFLYISLALLLLIIFIYSSFSSFIFCYRHSCVLRYVSFCFSTLVNRKK